MNFPWSYEGTVNAHELIIPAQRILQLMDVPIDSSDAYTNQLIQELTKQTLEIAKPRFSFTLFNQISFLNTHELAVGDETFQLGKIVLASLKASSHGAFFVCTAGSETSEFSKKLINEGNMLEALIVDLLGSEIAEATAQIAHEKIAEQMHLLHLKTTNRYSPGYCNWPVTDQQKLFKLLRNKTCGVSLNSQSLMLPIKSVSGLIGIGADVKNVGYACSTCRASSCLYREKQANKV